MKYYYSKSKNGYQLHNYLLTDLPLEKPIYGFMYHGCNNDYENVKNFKPVRGMIIQVESKKVGLEEWSSSSNAKVIRFVPFKKGTNQFDFVKSKHFNTIMYADTYKEAVEMYNEMISKEITKLYREITSMRSNYLKLNKYKKKRKKKKARNLKWQRNKLKD